MIARANNEDLMLIDHMLRPDSELQRLNLMTIMIQYWLGVQGQKKTGGNIIIGAYVTFIAEKLGLQLMDAELCIGPTSMDIDSLRLAQFLRIQKGPAGHRDRHFWRMHDGTERLLPFEAPISFTDDCTWRLDPQTVPQEPTTQTHHDAVMEEAPNFSHQVPGSSSHSNYDPSLQDIYKLMQEMSINQRKQGEQLDRYGTQMTEYRVQMAKINRQVRNIEEELREWRLSEPTYPESDDDY